MAKTAVVNPRRKRRSSKRRRRRNPSTAIANPRRRRYGAPRKRNARRASPRRRRRNPGPASSVYTSGGYRRTPNPDLFDFDHIMSVTPAATAGDFAARWAIKLAGPMESAVPNGPPVPGFKHALAVIIAARMGSTMIASVMGDPSKAAIAEIGSLAFGGSLFARKRLLADNKWVRENVYLDGEDDFDDTEIEDMYEDDLSGFESDSALGEMQLVEDSEGNVYALQGVAPDPATQATGTRGGMGGFETQSALGAMPAQASAASSFGYTSR